MFRLSRIHPNFTRTWFLSLAAVTALVLAASVLTVLDIAPRPHDVFSARMIEPGHLEMVVHAAGASASALVP